MHSTRKQKTTEKRSRKSDVMSDIENMEVMQGNFPVKDFDRQEVIEEVESDLRSEGRHREA